MARALLCANPSKLDLFSSVQFIHDEDTTVDTCFNLGLIPNVQICPAGHGVMSRRKEPGRTLSFRWYCKVCKIKVSPLANIVFSNVKIDFSRTLKLICLWYWRIPVSQAYIHAQITRKRL